MSLSSDSEDGRDDVIQIRNYQPSLTLRASSASRESSLSSKHTQQTQFDWPQGGVSTYSNRLFKSDGVSEVGSPRPVSAGQRANVQTQMSLQAKRRAERMTGGMYTSNDNMYRPGSPRVEHSIPEDHPDELAAASHQQQQRSRLSRQQQQPANPPTSRSKSNLFRGLRESYDPSAEDPEEPPEDLTPSSNYQPKSFQPLEAGGLPGLGSNEPVLQTAPSIDSTDIRTFLMSPGPKDHSVQCYIVREKTGGAVSSLTSSKGANQKYSLYLEDGRRFLMAARKRKQKTTSNYVISLDSEDLKRESGAFFGKLRSNFVGSDFTIYDAGMKRQAKKPVKKNHHEEEEDEDDDGLERQQLGCVSYQYNVLGTRGPRKMTAIIPQVDANGLSVFRPSHPGEHILDRARRDGGQYSSGLVVMHNKTPRWNEELNAYCLNFHGRVTEASVKNFQLVTDENASHVILQFGKTGRHTFTMDYQYPMSALQAFCICLSSFDNKLACE